MPTEKSCCKGNDPLLNHIEDDLTTERVPKRILNKHRISVTLPKNLVCFSYNINEIPIKASSPLCNKESDDSNSSEDESRQELTAMSVLSLYQNCGSDIDMDTSK